MLLHNKILEMQEHYELVLNNLSDGIFLMDQEMNVLVWNEAAERITGYSQEEIQQSSMYTLDGIDHHGVAISDMECPITATFQDGKQRVFELFLKHRKGYRVPVFLKTIPIHHSLEITAVMVVITDNSMRVHQSDVTSSLEKLAMTDPLTGLSSRRQMEILLHTKLENHRLYRDSFGVAFINLDDFSDCNDIYGYENGNQMLKALAKTFRFLAPAGNKFGRWGGEEFIGILDVYDRQQLKDMSESLRRGIEKAVIQQNSHSIRTTASIGATMANGDDTVHDLVERAISLMHVSKISGKNCSTLG